MPCSRPPDPWSRSSTPRRPDRRTSGWTTFFFLCLISLMTTMHDRYQPAYAWRRSRELDLRDS